MSHDTEPNAAVEIHDSTLETVRPSGDDLVVVIDAYVHRSAGRPGIDRGTGWSQSLELRFLEGKASGSTVTCPVELLAGRLVLSGEVFQNLISIPLDHRGSSRLELESWNDVRIVLEGEGVTATFVGPPEYIEEFAP